MLKRPVRRSGTPHIPKSYTSPRSRYTAHTRFGPDLMQAASIQTATTARSIWSSITGGSASVRRKDFLSTGGHAPTCRRATVLSAPRRRTFPGPQPPQRALRGEALLPFRGAIRWQRWRHYHYRSSSSLTTPSTSRDSRLADYAATTGDELDIAESDTARFRQQPFTPIRPA